MSLIVLDHLDKSYGTIPALRDLSLQVPEGCLYALLGPNGAGKTTTLRILATLLSPDLGDVRIAGHDALTEQRQIRRLIGYVAQEVAIDKILTGRELLKLQGDLYHLRPQLRNQRIDQLIDMLGMDPWVDRRCGTYSGGMRRRLDLAAGLLHDPQLLILDEPTVGLDIESRAVIWDVLRRLREEGTTVLLSTHYLGEVEALADRMAIIDAGTVIAEGTPNELKKRLGGDRVTLRVREFSNEAEAETVQKLLQPLDGVHRIVINRSQGHSLNLVVADENVLPRLRLCLEEAGIPVFALAQSRPSLDDVYLQATGRTLMDAELALAGQRDPKKERKQSMR